MRVRPPPLASMGAGPTIDDTNKTGGAAALSVVNGKISTISSLSSSTTVSSKSSSSEMIIGDDGRFIEYRAVWCEFVLRRWRPRDLAVVRLERGCRLGLAVDDAIGTRGGDRAAPSEFDGKISTMSLILSSTLVSSSSATSRSSRIMAKSEGSGLTSIIHLDIDGISATLIVKPTR